MAEITLGFSLHRPEMVPAIAGQMRRHGAVFLEEPSDPGFHRMISGELAVEDYLLAMDVEYPEFSRAMCRLLREMHADGKPIHQVEPFVQSLIYVQEFLADGHRPDELPPNSLPYHVYRAERAATGALLAYYQTVSTGSFESAVEAVVRFARADAARFRLRDSLRAQELARLVSDYASSYVEAGLMHFQLLGLLRRSLPSSDRVRPVFLAEDALKPWAETGRSYGPGDRLTLLYIFHPATSQPGREKLLAAQSMIYSRILQKHELNGAAEPFPHLRDEHRCIRAARSLSMEDCRALFPLMRRVGTTEARGMIAEYLLKRKSAGEIAFAF
jgi:hypothetical protein